MPLGVMLGRLWPGTSVEQLQAQAAAVAASLAAESPRTNAHLGVVTFPAARAKFYPGYRDVVSRSLGAFVIATGFVFLLAACNLLTIVSQRVSAAAARAGSPPVAGRLAGPHRSAAPRRGRRVRAAGIGDRADRGVRRSACREPVSGHVRHAPVPRPLDDVAHGRHRARELAGHGRTAGAAGSPAAPREPGLATDARRSDDEPVATRLAADAASRRFSSSCRRSSSQGRASSSAASWPAEAADLGFDREHLLVVEFERRPGHEPEDGLAAVLEAARSVEALSIVRSTSVSSSGPLEGFRSAILVGLPSGGPPVLDASQLRVGPRFFDTAGISHRARPGPRRRRPGQCLARGRREREPGPASLARPRGCRADAARRVGQGDPRTRAGRRRRTGSALCESVGRPAPRVPAERHALGTHSRAAREDRRPGGTRGGRRPPRADHLAGRPAPTIAGDRRRAAGLGPSARGGGRTSSSRSWPAWP